jgi:hypothetical protein
LSQQYELEDPDPEPGFDFANSLELSANLLVVENRGPVHEWPYEISVDVFEIDSGLPKYKNRVIPTSWSQWKYPEAQSLVVPVQDDIFGIWDEAVHLYDFDKQEWTEVPETKDWKEEHWIPVSITGSPDALVVVLKRQGSLAREIRVLKPRA